METDDVSSSPRTTSQRGRTGQIPNSASAPLVSRAAPDIDPERAASINRRGMPTSVSAADFKRKRSLIRPERSRINRDHPTYYYTQHAAQQQMPVLPSTTGNNPTIYDPDDTGEGSASVGASVVRHSSRSSRPGRARNSAGESVAREENMFAEDEDEYYDEDEEETDKDSPVSKSGALPGVSGLSPSVSPVPALLVAKGDADAAKVASQERLPPPKRSYNSNVDKYKPPSLWQVYCSLITFWAPSKVLSWCGMPAKARQSAWREKMGLISFILIIAAFVGFLTFGFTETVCSAPALRLRINTVNNGYMIIQGRAYDLTRSEHPAAAGIPSGSNVLYTPTDAGGQDGSFLFQNVNGNCKGLFLPADNSSIPHDDDGNLAWYFPCKPFNQDGSSVPNYTWPYYPGYGCHTSSLARESYYGLKITGEVYFTWDDVRNSSRNLVVYNGNVLDLDLLNWLDRSDIKLSTNRFNQLIDATDSNEIRGTDITRLMTSSSDRQIAKCLTETIRVGSVDTDTIGCIASDVVLYVSLVFIVVIVMVKFLLAVVFAWFLSWRVGVNYSKSEKKRIAEIEDWADDIYRPAPHIVNAHNNGAGNRGSRFFPRTSRFTSPYANNERSRSRQRFPTTMASQSQSSTSHLIVPGSMYAHSRNDSSSNFYSSAASAYGFPATNSSPATGTMPYSTSTTSLNMYTRGREGAPADNESVRLSTVLAEDDGAVGNYYHDNVVPQPPADYKPFNFPLVHSMCLVTAYSESVEGLRTTLDSIATTDYPNSHKLIIVVCDGLIRGAGNDMTTPEIVLSMMTDLSVPIDKVQPYSYVAVASGSKRHNMAKVYAGFYAYDSETVDPAKQQRVPMLCVVKCGTPSEAGQAKPGNRGKRDSQIILMAFFQKVMFDERMTELEYEIFSGIWRITGISPDMYEIVLMVDADTKVYPDSLTKMISCMVYDPDVMGLCGETKIANKRQSWVTMIQVFEYYVSHHLTKSFESVFGGVTCLPGCFCMYRIKAPKGEDGYWVPILANPDIVERYSDNVVDTLHKKNLLLLGEDRYLSTLMLRTFPKRKQIFVPQAVCKTQVPDTFRVLLSQRRRWINSTVHNLMELTLVNSLCGVFCASMQFVVVVELIGTLVLPVALAFTLYVVVIAIVRKPVPVIPLILLALVLGLPGVLIIVTAHRWSYVMWMLIYLLALPVWNFVLPLNAYWKFDDFSWGETRQVQGGDKGHDEAEGEFDSSQIKMRKWRDFEREKRPVQQSLFPRAQSPGTWPVEN
ncbi:chitin synthase-domain-containing protein [Lipomyces orientalis]|uniref:Chitin synthase-domain-containing protein n=1 Tax=Lipomyces orientalis TaxID=1233043 RepID=A0ACC3U0D9_9ASCO